MSESAGSCGVRRQASIVSTQPSIMDTLKDNYRQRHIARQEARKSELQKKGDEGSLNTREAMELAGYKIQDGLEKIAQLNSNSICYMA